MIPSDLTEPGCAPCICSVACRKLIIQFREPRNLINDKRRSIPWTDSYSCVGLRSCPWLRQSRFFVIWFKQSLAGPVYYLTHDKFNLSSLTYHSCQGVPALVCSTLQPSRNEKNMICTITENISQSSSPAKQQKGSVSRLNDRHQADTNIFKLTMARSNTLSWRPLKICRLSPSLLPSVYSVHFTVSLSSKCKNEATTLQANSTAGCRPCSCTHHGQYQS